MRPELVLLIIVGSAVVGLIGYLIYLIYLAATGEKKIEKIVNEILGSTEGTDK
jgi:hypothetical protein